MLDSLSTYRPNVPIHTDSYTPTIPVMHKGYSSEDTLESMAITTPTAKTLDDRRPPSVLLRTAQVLGFGLSVAASSFTVGHILSAAGGKLATVAVQEGALLTRALVAFSQMLIAGGGFLIYMGRGIFLSITVPFYMIFYRLPKWLFTEKLPILVNAISKIVTPIVKSIATRVEQVARIVYSGLEITARFVMKVVVNPIKDQMIRFAQWASPYIAAAYNAVAKVVTYVGTKIVHGAQWVGQTIIQPIFNGIVTAAQVTGRVMMQGIRAVGRFLEPATTLVWNVAKTVGSVISKGAARAAQVVQKAAIYVSEKVVNAVVWVAQTTKAVFTSNPVKAVAHAIMTGAKALGSAISKGAVWTYRLIEPVILFMTKVVTTVGRALYNGGAKLANMVYAAAKWMGQSATTTAKGIAAGAMWVGSQIAALAKQATGLVRNAAEGFSKMLFFFRRKEKA